MILYQGDCLIQMMKIPDKSIDLILCDLPYGMTDCKWDTVIPFPELWEQYRRVIKDNGAMVLFSAQPFTTKLIHSNIKDFRYCWYWLKQQATGFTYAKYQPMRRIEDICVFYRKAPTYNPQGLIEIKNPKPRKHNANKGGELWAVRSSAGEYTSRFKNYPKNVLEFGSERGLHPTQKPVALLEYLIKTYTNEGDTVLDNCMGSGSTGVASKNTGRHFIGIELSEHYFNIAKQRIETSGNNGFAT